MATVALVVGSLVAATAIGGTVLGAGGGPPDTCPDWAQSTGGIGVLPVAKHQQLVQLTLDDWNPDDGGCQFYFASAVATVNGHVNNLWVEGVDITNGDKTLVIYLNQKATKATSVGVHVNLYGVED